MICRGVPMPANELASREHRRALVEYLRDEGALRSARVADALLHVPREIFVPGLPLDEVYRPSEAIVTRRVEGVGISSASAPEVVALMLEQLDVRSGDRVLEIGAGTGYNAALLAHLVGPDGHVVTIDIDDDIVAEAQAHVDAAGYRHRVEVVTGDGALGHPDGAFDRIILTVAADDVAPAWREQLARPHGRLVLPLSMGGPQRCVTFVPADGYLEAHAVRNCSFIVLRGAMATQTGPMVRVDIDRDQWSRPRRTGVTALPWQLPGLHLWLVAHQPGLSSAWGRDVTDPTRGTLYLADHETVVLLGRADDSDQVMVATSDEDAPLAPRAVELLGEWQAAGKPTDADLSIRAYARGQAPPRAGDEVAIEQRWTTFILRWR